MRQGDDLTLTLTLTLTPTLTLTLTRCGELHLGGTLGTNLAELRAVLAAAPFVRAEWTVAMLDEGGDEGHSQGQNQGSNKGHAARAAHADASAGGSEGGNEGGGEGGGAQLEQRRRGAEAQRAELIERAFGTEATHSARPGAGQQEGERGVAATEPPPPAGCAWVRAPMQGEVVASAEGAAEGAAVREGSTLLVLQATKCNSIVVG